MRIPMRLACSALALAPFASISAQEACHIDGEYGPVIETEAIDRVWSGTSVGFDLLTEGRDQLVAYYNTSRNLVVAHRRTGTGQDFYGTVWNFRQLDTMLGWDNHNDVVMAISDDGHFHVLGNMHADRLVYYRTRYPGEVRSLERMETMVDAASETRVTYPNFMRGGDGTLFVRFRNGGSGSGDEILYRYDDESGNWSRLLETALTDGKGQHNAYFSEFTRGPDGRFHVAWVWRAQGGSTMNSMVSYARSADLVNWEDAAGNPLTLPITYETTPVAASVPNEQGMVNGHQHVGFDAQGRPLVTYFRYDEDRIAQAYLARFEGDGWRQHRITDLDRVIHAPNRRGIDTPRSVQIRRAPVLRADGMLTLDVALLDRPVRLVLDSETLRPSKQCLRSATHPSLAKWSGQEDKQLVFRWKASRGSPSDTGHVTFISWHTLPSNRDRAPENISDPSTLRVHVLRRSPVE